MTATTEKNKLTIENISPTERKKILEFAAAISNKNIFPLPVIYDPDAAREIKDFETKNFSVFLLKKVFDVINYSTDGFGISDALAEVITVCITWLEFLGYDEDKRNKLFAVINEQHEKLGLLEEE